MAVLISEKRLSAFSQSLLNLTNFLQSAFSIFSLTIMYVIIFFSNLKAKCI